jgi:hypothetical protein
VDVAVTTIAHTGMLAMTLYSTKGRFSLSARKMATLALSVVGMAGFLVPAAYADKISDAQISESVSVYIPVEGSSMLLARGTPVQVLAIDGENAAISLALQNGLSVQTGIPTKYLMMLTPEQDSLAGLRSGFPNRKTATFNIMDIHVDDDPTEIQEGITATVKGQDTFVPQVEVVVKTSKDFHTKNLFARAYFFDGSNQKIRAYAQPSAVLHGMDDGVHSDTGAVPGNAYAYIWPPILPQAQRQTIYFPLPDKLPHGWKVVIVFGTGKGAVSAVYPEGNEKDFNYPERELVEKTALDPDQEIADAGPFPSPGDSQESSTLAAGLPEDAGPAPLLSQDGHKIVSLDERNDAPGLPIMTFYVRYPQGLSPKDKVNGVLADVTWINEKKSLEGWIKRPSSSDSIFQFADRHNLAVMTWNTAEMYDNADSFTVAANDERNPDHAMEQCFRTWKLAVDQLSRNYNLPDSGFLIYGESRGAQWAHRIVLRCPEKFLAIHININSSYEEPTPEASHCLWLLTTGELEHGNQAARIFYHKAQALNYPILLRIYPGRAHEEFPEEKMLGLQFFEYALKLRDQQLKAMAADRATDLAATPSAVSEDKPLLLDDSLLSDFRKPSYYGDLLNGDVYSASLVALLPESQRVGIPDADIAKIWGYFHP